MMHSLRLAIVLVIVGSLLLDSCGAANQEKAERRRKKKRASVLYGGRVANGCTDCLCLIHYTLICSSCAPQSELLVPCGMSVMDLMIKAADQWNNAHPTRDAAANPYSFTTEYRGTAGQAVVGLAGIIPTDHTWQLYINGRHVTSDIKHAKVMRGGDSVTFRLIPKATAQKRSAGPAQKRSAGPEQKSPDGDSLTDILSRTRAAINKAVGQVQNKRSDHETPGPVADTELNYDQISSLEEKFETLWPSQTQTGGDGSPAVLRRELWQFFSRVLKQLRQCMRDQHKDL